MVVDITIKSNLFLAYPNEEADINPGRYGKRLAEYLKKLLEKNDTKVADLYPTDVGHELRIDNTLFRVFIFVGNIDGEDSEFFISIEAKKRIFKGWFKRISINEAVQNTHQIIYQDFKRNDEIVIT